ncbi:uncharacterized protein LOC111389605 [Olea europaea var. sylvestris]|uniref:Senescence regulator n=1 Tax=Olea europaea subsp. europaea TaxID=158383 RepID=A0A8S0T153_OLEEU|nr:uncharacterized protein LOC111389605 [Olea europaea var. sylvestris]CAA2997745.1 Hypothetical predicted protein [Olea europaea subsp. europaea]
MADVQRRGKALEDEDFQEIEEWPSLNEFSKGKKSKKYSSSSSSSMSAWDLSSAPTVIPKANSGSHEQVVTGRTGWLSSALVDIPDWSKILKRDSSNQELWDGECDSDDGTRKRLFDDFETEDGKEMVPPHEYLARRLAVTQIASFSMLEGVGSTLKGRDLSKLRNAILTKTGFLE